MHILTLLLESIPAHLKNTKQVLDDLNTIDKDVLNNACFESFDVTSLLYSNVDNQAATIMCNEIIKKQKRSIKSLGFKI